MNGLAGKRVVVTGGTSGIGIAAVERFRAEGCEVIALGRRKTKDTIQIDVADHQAVGRVFADIGAVDVVINNAGVSIRNLAVDITPGQWQQVLSTNLTGAFNVAQAAARRMLLDKGGVILNTASTSGLVGYRFYADYNATKAGVIELTKSLALEWAPTVRVNAVCPGFVVTPMQEAEYTPRMMEELNRRIPLQRHGTPKEVAGLFAYLASDEAAYFTGAVIVMDGGETAGSLASAAGLEG